MLFDARSNLMYVVLGTCVSHRLQDKAEVLFAEVHRGNMSKLDEHEVAPNSQVRWQGVEVELLVTS